MVRLVLVCLAVLALWCLHFEKQRKGDFDHPIALPGKSLVELKIVREEIEKVEINLMAMARQQEVAEVLCVLINNQSEFTLVEMECEIRNLTRDSKDIFTIRPVTGGWLPRNGFRKYFAEPKGIHRWTGNFGDRLYSKDRLQIKILKAYGFRM